MLSGAERDIIARQLANIAAKAGDVLTCFRSEACRRATKPDGSLVSEADLAAEVEIKRLLAQAFPAWPVISEENADSHRAARDGRFLLVDPLDGTRSFLEGGKDFCVLIALIDNGEPVAGAIHAPATGRSWWAGVSAMRCTNRDFSTIEPLDAGAPTTGARRAIVSKYHAGGASGEFCSRLGIGEVRHENSALKFVRLAEGEADLYPRLGQTMQWDVAAGDALLRALGGGVFDLSGARLRYGSASPDLANPDFIAYRHAADSTALKASAGA